MCGSIIHWRGHTEKLVIKSTTATGEYVALSRGNTASKHVMAILTFYGNTKPIFYLYTDNQAAEHIATQPNMNEHSRSIDLRHHSIRQDYIENGMRIGGVSSKDNTSDILTKFLQPELHHTHTNPLFPPRPTPTPRPRSMPEITPKEVTNPTTTTTTKDTTNTHLHNMVTHARSTRVRRSPRVHRRRRRHRPPENPQPPGSPQPCPSLIGHEKRTPLSHEDPHLRPLFNRVISSKAQLSHKDPHSFPFINKEYEAQCHTRTLTHERTLTRDPYLIGSTRPCLTRTLTYDPYQIGSNPAKHICPTRTLTYFRL